MLVELNYKKKGGLPKHVTEKKGKKERKKEEKEREKERKKKGKDKINAHFTILYYLGLKVLSPTSVPMHSMKTFLLITKLPSAASKSNGGGEFERGKRTNRSR